MDSDALLIQRALRTVARAAEVRPKAKPCTPDAVITALVAVGMPVASVESYFSTPGFMDDCSTKVHAYLCYLAAADEADRLKAQCIEDGLLADLEPF